MHPICQRDVRALPPPWQSRIPLPAPWSGPVHRRHWFSQSHSPTLVIWEQILSRCPKRRRPRRLDTRWAARARANRTAGCRGRVPPVLWRWMGRPCTRRERRLVVAEQRQSPRTTGTLGADACVIERTIELTSAASCCAACTSAAVGTSVSSSSERLAATACAAAAAGGAVCCEKSSRRPPGLKFGGRRPGAEPIAEAYMRERSSR
mmetsp:Transcript_28473/g.61230  ORF Transcript_28473/g.61230 Transcript_28473/m.61230 type:complete len:206 (+) Transcript_28473:83-700(+)